MINTYEDAVLKTVLWWSDKSFRTKANQNNGDNTPQGALTFMLMNMRSTNAQDGINDAKIKIFEEELSRLLLSEVVRPDNLYLDVDYHPCSMLANAAHKAGIDIGCFPCKSHTRIDKNNRVFAKYQYGSSEVEL